MILALSFSNSLNKELCLNIIDTALFNELFILDLESNTSIWSSGISIYEREKVVSILDYINKDVIVYII